MKYILKDKRDNTVCAYGTIEEIKWYIEPSSDMPIGLYERWLDIEDKFDFMKYLEEEYDGMEIPFELVEDDEK
jgi:hypothetical protein